MKNFIKTIGTFTVIVLGVFSFGSVAFADYSATVTFTTSGSFTVPQGVTSLNASLTAGGAGGGGGAFTYGGGGGGAGSSISNIIIPVTPGQVISYTVGLGGAGGTTGFGTNVPGGIGGNGGNTIFYNSTVLGGHGGQGAVVGLGNGIGGLAGGVGGTNGTDGASVYGERTSGGNGGTTAFGTAGVGGFGNRSTYTLPTAGTNGAGGGAGSGWAYYVNSTYHDAGQRGGDGLITLSYTADLTAPVLTINGSNPITIAANSVYTDLGATAIDNVDGNITANIITTGLPINTNTTGTHAVVYTVTDHAGNTISATRTVIITDQTAPVITVPATQIFEATGPITTPVLILATVTDNIGVASSGYSPSVFPLGTTTVTWTATDTSGNVSTATSLVVIRDTTGPTIVLNGASPMSFMVGNLYTELGAIATDLVNGITTVNIAGAVNTNVVGTYFMSYSSTDSSGNTTQILRTVNVTADTINPVITAPINQIFEATGITTTPVLIPATATDNFTTNPVITYAPYSFNVGITTVIWTATDVAGNFSTITSLVNIIDTTAPVITLNGSSTINILVGSPYIELGASSIDLVDGNVLVTATGAVNTSVIGTYYVLYTAIDSRGNITTSSRTVNVIAIPDTIAPIITILGSNPLTLIASGTATYIDAGATAFDAVDGTTTATTTFNNVNPAVVGNYSVIYSATDLSGNTATSSRTVNVVAPVLTTIIISPVNPSVIIGSSTQFIATTLDQVNNPIVATVFWGSSNIIVGTIGFTSGLFNGLALGTTTITAVSGSISTTTIVTVSIVPPVLTSISISPLNPTLTIGATTTFISTTLDQYGLPFATTTTWESSSTTIGTIDAVGLFTAISAGTTTITGTAGSLSTSTIVTVSISDIIAPTVPAITGASATGTIILSANISWLDSTDAESGLKEYLYIFDNNAVTSVSTSTVGVATTTATSTTYATAGTYYFHVAAIDNAGNISASTNYGQFVISDSAVLYTNSTIGGAFYTLFSPTLAQSAVASTTGTTTLTNSTLSTFWNVNNSTIANTSVDDVNLDATVATNSTLINSDIARCTVLNSLVKNYYLRDCYIAFSTIDPSSGLNHFENSTSTNSQIFVSDIYNSDIVYSYVSTSTISGSDINNSTSTDSNIATSTISAGSDINNSNVSSSILSNASLASSTINNSTITSADFINAVVNNDVISTGTIIANGTTTVISTSTPLANFINYSPVTSFLTSTSSLQVTITDFSADPNEGTPFADSWTYYWNFGDGASSTIATSSTNGDIFYTYATSGTYIITLTLNDNHGDSSTASTTVTVSAATPVLTSISISPLNPTLTIGATTTFVSTTLDQYGNPFATTTTWESSSTTIGTIDAVGLFTAISAGTTTITGTAGALSTSTVVTVSGTTTPDIIPPVITVLGLNPVTVVTGTIYTDAGATALDNIDGNLTSFIVTTNPISSSTPVGAYAVIYTVSDFSGNGATSTRTVNVVATPDTIPPVITILGSNPVSITVGGTYTDVGATALDNIDGDITSLIVTTGLPINTSATGTQYVTYLVIDGAGNSATSTRAVNVIAIPVDTVAPVITIIGGTPITITVGTTYTDLGATAIDNIDGTTTVTILSNDVNTSATGTYSVVYSATDLAGNIATAMRTVNVIVAPADLIPPVITIIGGTPTTVLASSTYTDQGATAVDNIDVSVSVSATGTVDTNILGIYSITYTATDSASNTATAIRTVNVVEATSTDNIPPVITITGGTPITVYIGSTYNDVGATAIDNVDGPILATTTSNNVNTGLIGTYTVVYSATDVALNVATVARTVNVISAPADNIPPVITIIGGTPTTVLASSTYTDQGATSYDAYDNATTTLVGVSNVNISIIGTYTVVYTATDIALNNSTATRTVNVIAQDTIPPVITILGSNPMSIIRTIPYVESGAIAIDGFDGSRDVAISGLVNTSATGTYIITYTSTDSSNNTASSTRIVNVIEDNIAPVITILGSNPANITVGDTYTDAGATALDNIDGIIIATTTSNNVNIAIVGTYSVAYSATDIAGNTATSTRIVNVNPADTTPPVITILGLNPVTVLLNTTYTDAGATALDVVDGVRPVTSTSTVNTSATGTYAVVYTSSDTRGNTATATRIVNVVVAPDTIPPVITILGSNPANITVGDTYTDAGATALDNIDGDITSLITTVSTVNAGVIGSYFVRYTVIDGAGNSASSTRTVNVVSAPYYGGGGGSAVSYKVGDTNHDGKIDEYDFSLMLEQWGKLLNNLSSDLNRDNKVDEYDFSLLMFNWK